MCKLESLSMPLPPRNHPSNAVGNHEDALTKHILNLYYHLNKIYMPTEFCHTIINFTTI